MDTFTVCDMRSLRDQAEKWLGVGSDAPLHVLFFGRTPADRHRYVCIEAPHQTGAHALFFFRHDDGNWRVFPVHTRRPMMADHFADGVHR